MILVGLMGYAQSGKDTAGAILVEEFGFQRLAFADKLRDFAYAVDPWVPRQHGQHPIRLHNLVDEEGWDQAKQNPEVRRLLQRIGTEGGRHVIDEDVWVDATMRQVRRDSDERYVITDVRFPNEVLAVKAREGVTWRVRRAGTEAVNRHASETALDAWGSDLALDNASSKAAFQNKVRRAAVKLLP